MEELYCGRAREQWLDMRAHLGLEKLLLFLLTRFHVRAMLIFSSSYFVSFSSLATLVAKQIGERNSGSIPQTYQRVLDIVKC